jgi:hypothetical protein
MARRSLVLDLSVAFDEESHLVHQAIFSRCCPPAHELYNGKVTIPPQQIPIPFPAPSAEATAKDPKAELVFDSVNKLRDDFLASLQEE